MNKKNYINIANKDANLQIKELKKIKKLLKLKIFPLAFV